MTPLAHQLTKRMIEDGDQSHPDMAFFCNITEDIHCFETTEIEPTLDDLARQLTGKKSKLSDVLKFIFLPAPKTWIEFVEDGRRLAFVLLEVDAQHFDIVAVNDDLAAGAWGRLRLAAPLQIALTQQNIGLWTDAEISTHVARMGARLALINTPHIIGRRQFMPHRGLERSLVRKFGAGRFPLNAWTEIKLEVNKPIEIDDGEPHEAHLTGKRALHFCRKHIRIRRGKLEYVSAHWRGDAAVGIKRSRYRAVRSAKGGTYAH